MARVTSRLFFTLTLPSIFGLLTILWFLKRRSDSRRSNSDRIENKKCVQSKSHHYQALSPTKLEINNSELVSTTNSSEMQLKEVAPEQQSQNCNGISHAKVNGVKKAVKVKPHENGNSCIPNGSISNGCSKDNMTHTKTDSVQKISNGIKALSINSSLSDNNEVISDEASTSTTCNSTMEFVNGSSYAAKVIANGHSEKPNSSTSNNLAKEYCNGATELQKNGNCSGSNGCIMLINGAKTGLIVDLEEDISAAPRSSNSETNGDHSDYEAIKVAKQQHIENSNSQIADTALCLPPNIETVAHTTNGYSKPELSDLMNGESSADFINAEEDEIFSSPSVEEVAENNKCPESLVCPDSGKGDSVCSSSSRTDSTCSSGIADIVSDIEARFTAAAATAIPCNSLIVVQPNVQMVYEFEIMPEDCGRLIGRGGQHVNFIKKKTNACIIVKENPFFSNRKSCLISGTEDEIDAALKMIRKRFPIEQFPNVTLSQINGLPFELMHPDTLKLLLPEGVGFEAILCATVTPGHFFLQQPTHPTYHTLGTLTTAMANFYSQEKAPPVENISKGNIVATSSPGIPGWFRAEVDDVYPERDECRLKYLDYGGFAIVGTDMPRQITYEFMQLPFQAAECYLAGVVPTGGEWSAAAKTYFEELAQGQFLHGCIIAYAPNRIPYVNLYRLTGGSSVFVNQELIQGGYATAVSYTEETSE